MSGAPRQGIRTMAERSGESLLQPSGRNRVAGWHRQGQRYFLSLDYAELPKVLVLSVVIGGLFAFIV